MKSAADNRAFHPRSASGWVSMDGSSPGKEALEASERLIARIREEMEDRGEALGFDRYMELALYQPGLGYYAGGKSQFGTSGDFVTASEIGALFARCVAHQCKQVLEPLNGGDVLEFGAGSGRLAADVLAEMQRLGRLPDRYRILELSAPLRERQRATLERAVPHLMDRVTWLNALPAEGFRGCVLANEVLDALPVRRFRRSGQGLEEQVVVADAGGLSLQWRPADAGLAVAVDGIEQRIGRRLPDTYISEICTLLPAWMQALADFLTQGAALLVDYGYTGREYYRPERNGGTLLCHYRHRAHEDPLLWPGLCDITANVDFTAAAHAADDAGLQVAGFTTQAFFLLGNGLETLLQDSDPTDPAAHLPLVQEAKTLTLPGEMGERFKVLALTKDLAMPWPAFAPADWRGRL